MWYIPSGYLCVCGKESISGVNNVILATGDSKKRYLMTFSPHMKGRNE